MSLKSDLIAQAQEKGLTLTGQETVPQLKELLGIGSEPTPPTPAPEKPKRSEAAEEAAFQTTANSMKALLDAEPKVGVFIPLMPGEPKGTQMPVEINGYKMKVPKGVPNVQVPKSVAEIIWRALGVEEEASSALRSANDPDRPLRLDLQSQSDRAALNS